MEINKSVIKQYIDRVIAANVTGEGEDTTITNSTIVDEAMAWLRQNKNAIVAEMRRLFNTWGRLNPAMGPDIVAGLNTGLATALTTIPSAIVHGRFINPDARTEGAALAGMNSSWNPDIVRLVPALVECNLQIDRLTNVITRHNARVRAGRLHAPVTGNNTRTTDTTNTYDPANPTDVSEAVERWKAFFDGIIRLDLAFFYNDARREAHFTAAEIQAAQIYAAAQITNYFMTQANKPNNIKQPVADYVQTKLTPAQISIIQAIPSAGQAVITDVIDRTIRMIQAEYTAQR